MRALPKRFQKAELTDLDDAVMRPVLDYAQNLRAQVKTGRGLLLSGPAGVGKTYALAALTKHYARRARQPSVVFETVYTFVERYAPVVAAQAAVDSWHGQTWSRTYETAHWLVLNDLGKDYRGGKLLDQAIYKIGRLLRTRAEACLITHVTTNLPLEEGIGISTFKSVYGDSIWSLTAEICDRFIVDGPDRREGVAP
jgi:DNA replication protein DnaC